MTRSPRLKRVVQFLFGGVVIWFASRVVRQHWQDIEAVSAELSVDWWRVAWSAGLVFVSYALLIGTWRAVVRSCGERLAFTTAARIWLVSNLGRYVPGKIWQIGAMGVMAQEAGVAASVAIGSSLVIALINILVGLAVVGMFGRELLQGVAGTAGVLWGAILVLTVTTVSLPWTLPHAIQLLARLTKRTLRAPEVPPRAFWVAALGCGIAWVCYGVAFQQLALALLGDGASGDMANYVAVFTLSYLLGFLALFAPGGIGVRELSMGALLVSTGLTSPAEATVLVVASRGWLTVTEIVPGLSLLAWPRAPRAGPESQTLR